MTRMNLNQIYADYFGGIPRAGGWLLVYVLLGVVPFSFAWARFK
jgi:hypothetical protein